MKKRYLARSLSERERIINRSQDRPYGVRVVAAVSNGFSGVKLLGIEEAACLILNEDLIIEASRIKSTTDSRWWEYKFTVDAFSTAAEAEEAGLRMASALLWTSISLRDPKLMLRYSGPLPCDVYDRRKSSGFAASGTITVTSKPALQFEALEAAWNRSILDKRLLLAMELFCAARFETTLRSRFIGMVSSLEPLAIQNEYAAEQYGPAVEKAISSAVESLKETDDIPDEVKQSLIGRIRDLRRESVRQAYLRLARQHLEDYEARALDEAYNLRSEMLHDGNTDPDLPEVVQNVEALVSKIFGGIIGIPCTRTFPSLPQP